ncbi:hypothetical protein ABT160_33520 [Streptomyces sp. NPDC001941]|uniref:hypothetical protein n=1 Tax=Streptomyces sp. NPDC001941 TaxID=3154659 RepID=UPI00332DFEA7
MKSWRRATAASAVVVLCGVFAGEAGAAGVPEPAVAVGTNGAGAPISTVSALAPAPQLELARPAATAPQQVSGTVCWKGRATGEREFSMTCTGDVYRVYVECGDGFHIFPKGDEGQWDWTLTCPQGTSVKGGGNW